MGNLVNRLKKDNQTETFNVVITPEMENFYTTFLQTTGLLSTFLSVLIIYLIIFRTPSQVSTRLQLDMIGLQTCFIIFDIHVCCLFVPKSTLPYFAGYCMGVLCGSIAFHTQMVFAIGVTLETLAMFFVCLLQRFVTLTNYIGNVLALNTIKTVALLAGVITPIYLLFLELSEGRMIQYLKITPKMLWILDKNGWIVYFVNSTPRLMDRVASVSMFVIVIIFFFGSLAIIIMMTQYISKTILISSKTHRLQTTAIRNLILQFTIFSIFLSVPVMVIAIPLLCDIDTGTLLFLISEAILCSHGIANSIVAIAFNSNFRRALTIAAMGNLVNRLKRDNQTETFNVVITPEMEKIYMTYLQTTGVLSTVLSILILYLIIFRTPAQVSTRLQFDMIGLQMCFMIFDIHVCCLFIPKSTLPYFAGYCLGILCGPITFHHQFIFSLGIVMETLTMFFVSLLQRFDHLTNSIGNALVLNSIKAASITAVALSPICISLFDFPKADMINYLEITPKMLWLTKKNDWMVYLLYSIDSTYDFLSRAISVISGPIVVILFLGSVVLVILMTKYISNVSSKSSKTQKMQATAIRNLILQFTVFSAFLFVPTMFIAIPLLYISDSGMIFLISELIMCSHGLANSIIALASNSNFRRAIIESFPRNSVNSPNGNSQSSIEMNQRRPPIQRY